MAVAVGLSVELRSAPRSPGAQASLGSLGMAIHRGSQGLAKRRPWQLLSGVHRMHVDPTLSPCFSSSREADAGPRTALFRQVGLRSGPPASGTLGG